MKLRLAISCCSPARDLPLPSVTLRYNDVVADFSQFPRTNLTTGRDKRATTEADDGFGVEVSSGGVNTLSTAPSGVGTSISLTVDGIAYPASFMENLGPAMGVPFGFGLGDIIDTRAIGNTCAIGRGDISFQQKVANCESAGGMGAHVGTMHICYDENALFIKDGLPKLKDLPAGLGGSGDTLAEWVACDPG